MLGTPLRGIRTLFVWEREALLCLGHRLSAWEKTRALRQPRTARGGFRVLQMFPVQWRVSSKSQRPERNGGDDRLTRKERTSRRENDRLGDLIHFEDPMPVTYVLIESRLKPNNVLHG